MSSTEPPSVRFLYEAKPLRIIDDYENQITVYGVRRAAGILEHYATYPAAALSDEASELLQQAALYIRYASQVFHKMRESDRVWAERRFWECEGRVASRMGLLEASPEATEEQKIKHDQVYAKVKRTFQSVMDALADRDMVDFHMVGAEPLVDFPCSWSGFEHWARSTQGWDKPLLEPKAYWIPDYVFQQIPSISQPVKRAECFANGVSMVVSSSLQQYMWSDENQPENPFANTVVDESVLLVRHFVQKKGVELFQKAPRGPELNEEQQQQKQDLVDLLARFILDYIFAVRFRKGDQLTLALELFVPLGADMLVELFVLPLLGQRPTSLSAAFQQQMTTVLSGVNDFLEDYFEALSQARKDGKSRRLAEGEVELRVLRGIQGRLKKLRHREAVIEHGVGEHRANQHRETILKRLIKPLLEGLELPSEHFSGEDIDVLAGATASILRSAIDTLLSPAFSATVLERITQTLLEKPEKILAQADLPELSADCPAIPDELKSQISYEAKRLAKSGLNLSMGSGSLMRGLLTAGLELLARAFSESIGQSIHEGMNQFLSADCVGTTIKELKEFLWEGNAPVFRACLERNPANLDHLRHRVGVVWSGALAATVTSVLDKKKIKTPFKGTVDEMCNRLSDEVFELIWRPEALKLLVYHYLLEPLVADGAGAESSQKGCSR